MGKPLGEKVDPKPTKEPPEWQPTSRPGIFKSRITGHFQTWFDQDGKPLPGTPNPSPIAEDPSAFLCFSHLVGALQQGPNTPTTAALADPARADK